MITAARITDERGTIAATFDGREWHGLTPDSRLWEFYQAWLDLGNSPTPYVAPTPPNVRQRVADKIAGDEIFSALIDVLSDETGKTRAQLLLDLEAKL